METTVEVLTGRLGSLVDLLRTGEAEQATLGDVASVTEIVIRVLSRYLTSIDSTIYRECDALSKYIVEARREIATIQPKDLRSTRLPRAGKELDAIVRATEEATGDIMGAAEEMMAASGTTELPQYQVLVEDACIRIFEACAFQDITGQRVAKVVQTLDHIEARLEGLQSAWGGGEDADVAPASDAEADASLMSGPALEGEGMDQDSIDAILSGESEAPPETAPSDGADKSNIQNKIDSLFG